jgi:hypothetical protein
MEVDEKQLIGLLGQGGITAALLFLIWKVGMAMVGAIKDQGTKLDKHTMDENEHHTLVREELAALRAHHGIPTPVHGVPVPVARQPSSPVLAVVGRPRGGTNSDDGE